MNTKTSILAMVLVLGGCASTIALPPIPDVTPPTVTDRSAVNSIAIERLVVQARGQSGVISVGILCIPNGTLRAGGSGANSGGYLEAMETVQREFDAIGYPVTTSPTELFTTVKNDDARLRLAGRVTDVHNNVCFPLAGFGDITNGSADSMITVEWQVYDNLTKNIAVKLSTIGFSKVSQTGNPLTVADTQALGMSVRRFLASPEFQGIAHAIAPLPMPAFAPSAKQARR
jgi:hypothetical protein